MSLVEIAKRLEAEIEKDPRIAEYKFHYHPGAREIKVDHAAQRVIVGEVTA